MFKAVLKKEWIKTKWFVIGIAVVSLLLHIYMFIKLGRSMRFTGIIHLWDVVINKEQFVFREIRFFPIIAGLSIGLSQFIPEIYQKRLKLALHLPLKSYKIIFWNIAYGLICLSTIFIISMSVLLFYISIYFSFEFVESGFFTILPWYLSGIATYLFMAWIVLEPRWDRRIINSLITLPLISMFLLDRNPAAYMGSVIMILIITILSSSLVYLSVLRFKDGK
jgi:hypothetical protein